MRASPLVTALSVDGPGGIDPRCALGPSTGPAHESAALDALDVAQQALLAVGIADRERRSAILEREEPFAGVDREDRPVFSSTASRGSGTANQKAWMTPRSPSSAPLRSLEAAASVDAESADEAPVPAAGAPVRASLSESSR